MGTQTPAFSPPVVRHWYMTVSIEHECTNDSNRKKSRRLESVGVKSNISQQHFRSPTTLAYVVRPDNVP